MRFIALSIAPTLLLSGCADQLTTTESDHQNRLVVVSERVTRTDITVAEPVMAPVAELVTEPVDEPDPWTDDELDALALTLAGECYDRKVEDKRRVCEVVLNRVSHGGFGGNSILAVLTAENQFDGYWTQSRPVSMNDYEVAEQALRDWYENDCKALSEYLFFSAGDNHENRFRSEF